MAITLSDFNKIWASTSPLTPYSFSDNNYKQGWNFVGGTPPARQMWDSYMKFSDEKQQYIVNNFLPLSGGTMTNSIVNSTTTIVTKNRNDSWTQFNGGNGTANGANLILFGKDESRAGAFWITANDGNVNKQLAGKADGTLTWNGYNVITSAGGLLKGRLEFEPNTTTGDGGVIGKLGTGIRFSSEAYSSASNGAFIDLIGRNASSNPGRFSVVANSSEGTVYLIGNPNGSLTWNGQPVQTSSDKRLKTDFADVSADVLEAWEKVEWKQFKYIADKERKGDSCRFHTGLVAQDVHDVCGDEILKYGILCQDEETEMWTIRYTEALCMEVAFLRKKLKAIEEKLANLEK